jgi:acetylornithine deacetylase
MSSSRAGFVVPDHCEAWIDLHLQPHHDPALIQAAIQQIATSAKHFIAGLDLDIAFDFASSGFNLGTANDLTQSLPAIYGL